MIRKAGNSDFDFIYELYMHPHTNPWLLYEPMDRENFRPVFDDLLEKNIKYVYQDGDTIVGMFKLIPLQYRTDHIAYLGGLAIHPGFTGKGHGKKMLAEVLAFAKQQGLLRIELSTATINEKAIRLYEHAGFEKEGVLRKYTHLQSDDRFLDEVLMSYIIR